ncbi:uroporphyrinogen-III synthase [Microbacterium sp. zg.Y1090]|uniref:uroporphyrinogen-III synthase n=1 Tax=Microbacterium TaxID=33882 RepID=UPI00214C915F|nr:MULTISPECIES: uroporphyrinogen-III synthase [unclassified Microbacterium]MCR2813256.1 uroporphyrinogen-III synthase [Microbacterium sp. zg.Y1084]MCR2819569.1 uroporphyrinogen-III synthase [Microbacterium sp. zg.Y1090]MDL5487423.1 uroporphyrinogen-III synthase [Microbacterium sp. zg-Y1211]WIM28536.1 uroporphyrinogen-III synthase [Microbacterium sp. zg-Y1090]
MNTAPWQSQPAKPLSGWRVLVPRGGPWGDGVAATLRAQGATPVIAPLINFAPSTDQATLEQSLADLAAGTFDWLTITSATTVDVLYAYRASIPAATKVAAVGETTAAALAAVGYKVDLVPEIDNSASGMADQLIALEAEARDILTLRSEIAKPVLTERLAEAGHRVRSVVAYRTVGVPVTEKIALDVQSGRINAILITSGSVAEQVREQFPAIPEDTVLAAIGPRTAEDARKLGLPVTVVAAEQTVAALIGALSALALPHSADETVP